MVVMVNAYDMNTATITTFTVTVVIILPASRVTILT